SGVAPMPWVETDTRSILPASGKGATGDGCETLVAEPTVLASSFLAHAVKIRALARSMGTAFIRMSGVPCLTLCQSRGGVRGNFDPMTLREAHRAVQCRGGI